MKKRTWSVIIVLAACLVVLAACKKSVGTPEDNATANENTETDAEEEEDTSEEEDVKYKFGSSILSPAAAGCPPPSGSGRKGSDGR